MGSFPISPESLYMIIDLYNEVDISIKNNSNLNINDVVKHLSSFCFSEKLIPYLGSKEFHIFAFYDIISLYEMKEKFLSFKIFFPLFEELKNLNFENIIKEIKKHFNDNILSTTYKSYISNNKNSIEEFGKTEIYQKALKEITEYIENKQNIISDLNSIYCGCFMFLFEDEFNELIYSNNNENENKLKMFFGIFDNKKINEKEINCIWQNLIQLNSLKYSNNVYQNLLFALNIHKNNKEISLRDNVDKEFFDNYEDSFNINEKLIWKIYEEDLNVANSDKKYLKTILEGKMTEKEKYNFDIFDNIFKIKIKEDLKGINGGIFKSIFYNTIILILKIDVEYFKNNKTTLEQIKDEINLIQKSCPSEYKIIDTYIHINNKIMNFYTSYNSFIQELKDRKIIDENKIAGKENDSMDKNEIIRLKLLLEEEKEKNKKLEMELKEEKNKNKKLEMELIEEKNKNKELKEKK